MEKIFNIHDKNVVLKISFINNIYITEWMHEWNNFYTNKKLYDCSDKLIKDILILLNNKLLIDITDFLNSTKKSNIINNQLSLF